MPSFSGGAPRPDQLRAADSDRELIVTVLRDSTADGRLTMREFEERTELAFRARTLGELNRLVADLLPPESQPLRTDTRPAMAFFRSERKEGRWIVPPHYSATAICANVTLDLREAVLQTDHIRVQVTILGGSLTLLVPKGVRVIMPASAVLGSKKSNVKTGDAGDAPTIEIAGFIAMGSIHAKTPKTPRPPGGWRLRRLLR
ncbi:DUF1707 SHOCT-like domain-containing protein [Sinosporangium siamense]|uniref:DUF1707 SHOCT-like domain-containing protein n=1 Tax=Sinosporangium siamense TaxID=1367973 RepID=UPI001EF1BA99|nr:DUF1707 domain-containing protein [Sinosporangium siamense]